MWSYFFARTNFEFVCLAIDVDFFVASYMSRFKIGGRSVVLESYYVSDS